jgi:rod shape-determining protein MreB and related proteins
MKRFLKCSLLLLFCSLHIHGLSFSLKPWTQFIGLDLGTRNSVVVNNEGGKVNILSNTPSAVCYYRDSGNLICFGQKALEKIGKCPDDIVAVRPLKDGVIYSLKATNALIQSMLQSAGVKMGRLTKTNMVIGIPCAVKAGDIVAIEKCAKQLGVSDVLLVKEPIAAAIDAGLAIGGDIVHMVIDIGGGTTDILAIAQYGALSQEAITIAGDAMDKAIVDYIREHFRLSIDEETAQEVKCKIGAVYLDETEEAEDRNLKMEVSGMDILQQIPRKITVSTRDIIAALKGCTDAILDATHSVMRKLPQRASGDVAKNGILLVGGGAIVPGMKEMLEQRFGIPVTVPNEPLLAIARGIGKILGDFENYKKVLTNAADDF